MMLSIFGDKNDEPKEPLVLGEVDTEKNLEKFSFEVPLSMAGKEVHYVPRNGRTQKFSTSSALALTIPSLDAFKKQTEIVIQSQPKDVAAKNDTQVSLSVIANGEESAKLSYQWQLQCGWNKLDRLRGHQCQECHLYI